MAQADQAEVAIWTDSDHVAQIDRVLRLMGAGVKPVCVGGLRVAEAADLARQWGCDQQDDLRKMLLDHPARFVLLGSVAGAGVEDLQAAAAQGCTVLTLEPIAAELDHLLVERPRLVGVGATHGEPRRDAAAGLGAPSGAGCNAYGRIEWAPAFDRSPGWVAIVDPLEAIGSIHQIGLISFGQAVQCSLFARTYDAWRMVTALGGLPQEIDASLTGPLGAIPENPRGMTGHLGVHARMGSGCLAVMQISDCAGYRGRQMNILGDQGHLCVTDLGYQLYDTAGRCLDQHQPAHPNADAAVDFDQLIASHWQSMILDAVTQPGPTQSPGTTADVHALACCLACLLSARTGHPESPRKLLDLHRR